MKYKRFYLVLLTLLIPSILVAGNQGQASKIKQVKLDPTGIIPGAKSMILPASSFVGEGASYGHGSVWGKSGTGKRLYAPVHLPDRAVIRVFSVRFVNRTPDMYGTEPVHLTAILERAEFTDPSPTTQITQASVNTPEVEGRFYGVRSDSSIEEPRVDNSRFLYQVIVYPNSRGLWRDSDLAVSAVKITYTIP